MRVVGGSPQILDYLNYAGVAANESYGSVPDGQPFFRSVMFHPTPGATNDGRSAPIGGFPSVAGGFAVFHFRANCGSLQL